MNDSVLKPFSLFLALTMLAGSAVVFAGENHGTSKFVSSGLDAKPLKSAQPAAKPVLYSGHVKTPYHAEPAPASYSPAKTPYAKDGDVSYTVDQYTDWHTEKNSSFGPISANKMYAQSFVPSVGTLDKVDMWVSNSDASYDEVKATFHLRSALNGADIESAIVVVPNSNSVSVFFNSQVTAGQTYYIVVELFDPSADLGLGIGLHTDNPYKSGSAYVADATGAWYEVRGEDVAFKTYYIS